MNKMEFINSVKQGALKGKECYGLLPSLTIAQAILESGWGSSRLAQEACNLFGIKAFQSWKGRRITLPTTEWSDGKKQVVEADFRVYSSFNESIEDHNRLLSYMRYMPVRNSKTYEEACRQVYECGYATDPEYSNKLISIIEENQLYRYDSGENIVIEDGDKDETAAGRRSNGTNNVKNISIVLSFQRLCNAMGIKDSTGKALVEDNVLGWRTLSCARSMPELAIGSRGEAVKFVQEVVMARPIDGIFGGVTRGCVIKFQEREGLYVDGIVGKQTWVSLINQ